MSNTQRFPEESDLIPTYLKELTMEGLLRRVLGVCDRLTLLDMAALVERLNEEGLDTQFVIAMGEDGRIHETLIWSEGKGQYMNKSFKFR